MAYFFSSGLLILSAIHFISTFGVHVIYVTNGNDLDKPMYAYNPILSAIPWISGYILPVIPLSMVIPLHWGFVFLINLAIVWLLGPSLTRMFLKRWHSLRGYGYDRFFALVSGIVIFVIGLIIHLIWVK
jgi:hypothetical protein